jgi:hypothetical protein
MAILIKNGSGKWQKAVENSFNKEDELQELLYLSPELIEREDEGIVVFTRESTLPGSGNTDLIGVSSNGDILLIETKLAKNLEIRRKVIGQILEYAAFLWGMSYEDFDRIFAAKEGKPISELLADRGADIELESFRATVSDNLSGGRFDLLIVVDEMNDELEKIISYISSFDGGVKLEALAVKVHKHNDLSVLVPQRFGQLRGVTSRARGRGKVTIDIVLESAPDAQTRELLGMTLNGWKELGFEIAPGSSGFSCKAEIEGKSQPVFWVIPEAGLWSIEPLFGSMIRRGAPPTEVENYRREVSKIAGFPSERCLKGHRPPAKIAQLTKNSVQAFNQVTRGFVEKWRSLQS